MWQSHGLLFPSTANLVDFDWACVSKSRPIGSYCTLQANLQGGFEWWQQQNPIGPVMQTPNKRRLYTEQEDIMLLRQVNAERPFEAKKGEVMKVWGLVAKALADHEDFARPQFDAKKAQNRFSAVMDNHVHYNRESARASGVAETYDERIALLDELLAAFVDAKEQEKKRLVNDANKVDQSEREGEYIRNEAMNSLGKRKHQECDDDGEKAPGSGSRFTKITTAMQEESKAERGLRQSELEFRKFQLEVEREERQKDRELAAEQARLHHETILAMLGALTKRQ
ncbi:hypothetical protein DYB26_015949 [Aphanomyces astaci]|uniref:Myb-like domain-containing protein n=1 Tax=Aphanomyces astaci TaxID=112090 RepID=A0A418CLF4_APHAT|nr:hypothetical protein DYB26_015949 [Aphanomyces astaci]